MLDLGGRVGYSIWVTDYAPFFYELGGFYRGQDGQGSEMIACTRCGRWHGDAEEALYRGQAILGTNKKRA